MSQKTITYEGIEFRHAIIGEAGLQAALDALAKPGALTNVGDRQVCDLGQGFYAVAFRDAQDRAQEEAADKPAANQDGWCGWGKVAEFEREGRAFLVVEREGRSTPWAETTDFAFRGLVVDARRFAEWLKNPAIREVTSVKGKVADLLDRPKTD